MSVTALAELLDQLHELGKAYLNEGQAVVTVSNLGLRDTKRILVLCRSLGWEATALDRGETEWTTKTIRAKFAPFVVPIRKPPAPSGTLQVLTRAGLRQKLASGDPAVRWRIARLTAPILTWGLLLSPWFDDDDPPLEPAPRTKSPRTLVRESGASPLVPADIRPWVLVADTPGWSDDAGFQLWADAATRALIHSLADEIDPEKQELCFRGPPRLALAPPSDADGVAGELGEVGFEGLQESARWIFESEREAEMRHILLGAEIARSGGDAQDAVSCVRTHIAASLQGARIAYQTMLADLSRDTLKLLGELRKAVTEETAKVTEATRQNVTAVATALALGLGLLAARVTAVADPWLIRGIMLVIAVYVLTVIYAGNEFVMLQRRLRRDWKTSLYRFLPDADYARMVDRPARAAESVFRWTAGIGGGALILLSLAVLAIPDPGVASAGARDISATAPK